MDLALGELGMDREKVLRMSWADFWRTAYGYWIRRDQQWDRTRHILAMLYNVNRGKGRAAKKPRDIYPLVMDRMGRRRLQWTEAKKEKYEQALYAWGGQPGKGQPGHEAADRVRGQHTLPAQ